MKKQTIFDDLQRKQEEQDDKNSKKEADLVALIDQIKLTQNNTNEQFRQVKEERRINLEYMERQCQKIQDYKDELWVSKRDTEKRLNDGEKKLKLIVDKSIMKMDDLMIHINQIKQRQDLISEQFKKFGEGIDINSKRLDDVDATLKYFRYHHADKYIMEEGISKLDK